MLSVNQVLISKLILNNFRNFLVKEFYFSSSNIVFLGCNGVGKTNAMEAISLVARNNSLRNSEIEDMINNQSQQFINYYELLNHQFIENIRISFDNSVKKKSWQINGEPYNSKRQGDIKNFFINFIFLNPQIEQLFISGKSSRRDYLDKIITDIDFNHLNRINNYQKLLKERLIILQNFKQDNKYKSWLEIVENKIVELGIAIASARIESIEFFNKAIASFVSSFPKVKLLVIGDVENAVMKHSSIQIENLYKQKLEESRVHDLESFKTNFGIHRSDFDAIFLDKNISATQCSTGEQKAIMASITLARAKISVNYKNQPTIMMIDEIASHLDNRRKNDLFEEIFSIKVQSFFSATSADLLPNNHLQKMQQIIF